MTMQPQQVFVLAVGLVRRGDALLMVQMQGEQPAPFWALPGGRVEADESITDALFREILEETGLGIEDADLLYLSQGVDAGGRARPVDVRVRMPGLRAAEVKPDDPDGLILDARFMPTADAIGHIKSAPWGLADPLVAYRGGEPIGGVWTFRRAAEAGALPALIFHEERVPAGRSGPQATVKRVSPYRRYPRAMGAPRLLVIQHELDDHLNELGGPLVDAGLAIEPWFTYARLSPLLDVAEYDGVVTLGAIVGVKNEADHPWMSVERQVLEKAVAGGTPTLGICFGAQLLASVGGAPVHKAASAEIGWTPVEMDSEAADDPVLSTLGTRPHVFQFHYDTFGEPETGAILGRTGSLNQVARIGERAWAVQFHLEVSPGAIYSWVGTYGDEMREQGADLDGLAAETAKRWQEYRRLARAFGEAFAREVTAFAARR